MTNSINWGSVHAEPEREDEPRGIALARFTMGDLEREPRDSRVGRRASHEIDNAWQRAVGGDIYAHWGGGEPNTTMRLTSAQRSVRPDPVRNPPPSWTVTRSRGGVAGIPHLPRDGSIGAPRVRPCRPSRPRAEIHITIRRALPILSSVFTSSPPVDAHASISSSSSSSSCSVVFKRRKRRNCVKILSRRHRA